MLEGPILGATVERLPGFGGWVIGIAHGNGQFYQFPYGITWTAKNVQVRIDEIDRADGQPDTGGNSAPLPGAPIAPDTPWNPLQVTPLPQRSQPPGDTPQQPTQAPEIPYFPGILPGGIPSRDTPGNGPQQWPHHRGPSGSPHPDNAPGNLGGDLPEFQPEIPDLPSFTPEPTSQFPKISPEDEDALRKSLRLESNDLLNPTDAADGVTSKLKISHTKSFGQQT